MMTFGAAILFQLPPVQAAAPAPEPATEPAWEYSITNFVTWNRQVFSNAANWCVQHGCQLLTGAAALMLTIALTLILLLLIRKFIVSRMKKKFKNAAGLIQEISGPLTRLLFWFGFSFSVDLIPFSTATHKFLDKIFYVCFILTLLHIIQHALKYTASQMLVRFKEKNPEYFNMNKLLLDLTLSTVRLLVGIYVIIFICQEVFHLKVTHLIASAGILGLGVAFAAKDTIANIFGAFAILVGKMFRVGDRIKAGSVDGIVDQIGIRSIRVRPLDDGRLVDIPNHLVADSQIENFSTRRFWREHFCFGLVYETTPEQLTLAKKILEDIGRDLAELQVEGRPPQFDFLLFDQSSLNLDGFVWFKASDFLTMRHSRGRFNEEVLKRFTAAGLNFAFPSTTVYLADGEIK